MRAARGAGVPLVRRFSGGGTVVVDSGTVFTSIVLNANAVPAVACYPRPVMELSARWLRRAFAACPDFALRENGGPLILMPHLPPALHSAPPR